MNNIVQHVNYIFFFYLLFVHFQFYYPLSALYYFIESVD
jgi:hypothetical protein